MDFNIGWKKKTNMMLDEICFCDSYAKSQYLK
jgi:hypothetical protein